jgi:hypothetical protein
VHELNDLGLLGDDVNYGHGYQFTDAELGLIASSGGSITVSPSVEMSMALGTFRFLDVHPELTSHQLGTAPGIATRFSLPPARAGAISRAWTDKFQAPSGCHPETPRTSVWGEIRGNHADVGGIS